MKNYNSLANCKIYYARVDFNWQIHWVTFSGVFVDLVTSPATPISAAKKEILTIKMLSRLVSKLYYAAEGHSL